MVTNDATILKIKHDILCEVAKLAWEGTLEEKREATAKAVKAFSGQGEAPAEV